MVNKPPVTSNNSDIEFSDEDLDILAEYLKALVDIDLEIKEGATNDSN
ncbi:MAG: hypothetical protein ACREF7_04310 [Candidatus Saccharimonadales bacterium]